MEAYSGVFEVLTEFTPEAAKVLLRLEGTEMERLFKQADELRATHMGDEVFLRGIIEFSNVCSNDCLYCGIRASNHTVHRYTISADEIIETAKSMSRCGITTIVLQSGETQSVRDKEIGELISRIKAETKLAVTMSVGNRNKEVYRYWHQCGMDRYLLRFETSDAALFEKIHPNCTLAERLQCLRDLKDLGVQTGSGFMIGVPGETLDTLADNIVLCRTLNLDMIGIGPFIPHPATPLGGELNAYGDDYSMFFKAVSVLRLFNPDAHIPATTAFDAILPNRGRNLVLQRGANVFMPNSTPTRYREDYLLYPNKPCLGEDGEKCASCVVLRVKKLGRKVGQGPGHTRIKSQL